MYTGLDVALLIVAVIVIGLLIGPPVLDEWRNRRGK
jgi:hypothetical protein